MTVFKFTGQWIIARNIDTIMGLQATATKRKLELEEASNGCDVEERLQDDHHSHSGDELTVDEVDGSVSPPKITKYDLPEAAITTTTTSTSSGASAEDFERDISDKVEDATVQELANECKSTYISHDQPMVVEDSIAKLEAVAVPGEIIAPWTAATTPEPVAMDSISRLQAVAVPDEGADGTRSALATTLLSTSDDLCDDDDDDFDDDFDDEDHLPPRYAYPPARGTAYGGYSSKLQTSPPHSYYVDYPPQMYSRNAPQGYNQRGYNWQGYGYEQQQQQQQQQQQPQQTIRCAENGKSYLELGSSSNSVQGTNSGPYQMNGGHQMHQMHARPHYHHPSYHHHHHQQQQQQQQQQQLGQHPSAAMKRCCDGRPSTWCQSSNKQCYKDRRMSMLNLSMFKLSRFRQVSEQSLYRSVLICNTLKQLEREIELENKEAAAARQHHHQQQMHLHAMHQQQMHHMQQQQQQQQGSSGEYSNSSSSSSNQSNSNNSSLYQRQTTTGPVFSQPQLSHHSQMVVHHNHHQQQQQQMQFLQSSNTDGVTYSSQSSSNSSSNSFQFSANSRNSPSPTATVPVQQQQQPQQPAPQSAVAPQPQQQPQLTPLLPFSDASSGRATPFPAQNSAHSDADSGFGDEDCTRPINWGSVLSLSSQSALDPLASDLFSATGSPLTPITPTMVTGSAVAGSGCAMADQAPANIENGIATSAAHLKVLTSVKEQSSSGGSGSDGEGDSGISMMDEEDDEGANPRQLLAIGSSNSGSSLTTATNNGILRTTTTSTATTTTTSSAVVAGNGELLPWLDMESELTELLPSWKLTPLSGAESQSQQPIEPTRIVHEADMEQGFTHIMVVS